MFIRYNEINQFWEYDLSGGLGTSWAPLPIDISLINGGNNIAYTDRTNTFNSDQHFNGNIVSQSSYYEKGRATPIGHWIDFTPVLSVGVGTVTLNDNLVCNYTLIGKTLILNFYLFISLSAAPTVIYLNLPTGFTTANHVTGVGMDNLGLPVFIYNSPGTISLGLFRTANGTGTWPANINTIGGSISLQVL